MTDVKMKKMKKKALDADAIVNAYSAELDDDDMEMVSKKMTEAQKKKRDAKAKEDAILRAKEAAAYRMLPKKEKARAAKLPELNNPEHIKLIPVGKSVVYYYGMSLPKMRELDKKLDAIAEELYTRSCHELLPNGMGSNYWGRPEFTGKPLGGSREFELKQEAVQDVERFPSGATMNVTKYYYIAKRIK